MSDVTVLPVVMRLDISSERVLTGAQKADLASCTVIGFDKDGQLYFASSKADNHEVLWMLEKAKKILMEAL